MYEQIIREKYQKEWERIKSTVPSIERSTYARKLQSHMEDELMRSNASGYTLADAHTPVRMYTDYNLYTSGYTKWHTNPYMSGIDPASIPNTHIPESTKINNKPSKILLLCH